MAGSRNLTHAPGKLGRRPVVPRKTAPQRIFAFRPERTMPEALFAVRIDRRRKWRISAGSTGDESQRFRRDRLHQCTSRIEPKSDIRQNAEISAASFQAADRPKWLMPDAPLIEVSAERDE